MRTFSRSPAFARLTHRSWPTSINFDAKAKMKTMVYHSYFTTRDGRETDARGAEEGVPSRKAYNSELWFRDVNEVLEGDTATNGSKLKLKIHYIVYDESKQPVCKSFENNASPVEVDLRRRHTLVQCLLFSYGAERNSTSANSSGLAYDSMWKYLWNMSLPPKNSALFKGIVFPSDQIISKASTLLQEYQQFRSSEGMALRNHRGETLMFAAFRLNHSLPPKDEEVEVVCLGIQHARDAGFRVFTLESNSLLLVNHVQKRLVLPP
ncbi:hypothetical protein GH714_028596 [Hevea brasiliensis]|uniref:RNase H type-1 domain-containing protein n=1 Tax=Hevea brasiliensis TaxID=3981 RepID=A0A6A6KAZ7_HEVBR|nr:hypothetical protein GH714_028596 [Hevea brasiliensis]